MTSATPCLDENVLQAFALGEPLVEERDRIEAHLDGCAGCRQAASVAIAESAAPLKNILAGSQRVLAQKYRIDRVIGAGGMGWVVQATHLKLKQRYAIKFLAPERAHDKSAVGRLLKEARAAAQLSSPHVCRVFDVAEAEGTPYLVMEFLEGEDLEKHLERTGPLPAPEATRLVLQVLEGLKEAHRKGLVHRDLKPSNLFVTRAPDGTLGLKILDFGIVKELAATDGDLSQTSPKALVGSPRYMAPEQLKPGAPVDARTDIWGLGCCLFQMLTGKPPFDGASAIELATQIQRAEIPHITRASRALNGLVRRCLRSNPNERFDSAEAVSRALGALRPKKRRTALLIAGLAMGLGGVALVTLYRSQQKIPETSPALLAPNHPVELPTRAEISPVAAPAAAPTEPARPVATEQTPLKAKGPATKRRVAAPTEDDLLKSRE